MVKHSHFISNREHLFNKPGFTGFLCDLGDHESLLLRRMNDFTSTS